MLNSKLVISLGAVRIEALVVSLQGDSGIMPIEKKKSGNPLQSITRCYLMAHSNVEAKPSCHVVRTTYIITRANPGKKIRSRDFGIRNV